MTTGFGVAAFYPEPVAPRYPTSRAEIMPKSCYDTPESAKSPECQQFSNEETAKRQQVQADFDIQQQAYMNKNAGYTRTAVFLGVLVGALFAMVALMIIKTSPLVANGFLFGAVLTAVLTRILISLASLGANTTGTETPGNLAFIEFFLLVLATIGVTVVGFRNLVDENKAKK